MVTTKKSMRGLIVLTLSMVMLITSALPTFAATPAKEKVDYEGKGKVEMEFVGKVSWSNPKVTVTDNTGKKYAVTTVRKDDDEISFVIRNFTAGKKYNVAVSGVKKRGTSGYGTVTGVVTIPKAKAAVKKTTPKATVKKTAAVTKATAKNTAISDAVKRYKIQKNTVRDFDIEKDRFRGVTVWEVSFEAKKSGKRAVYEYDYKINLSNGKILKVEQDVD